MSEFPNLPLFTDAFIADTSHLSAQETGAYLMLLMVAWRSPGCSLPDDDMKLARWARVDRRTWTKIKPAIMEFWTLNNGTWTQKRLSKEREIVSKRAEAARENGKHGGRPKSLENNATGNPAGSSRVTQRKAPNPNPIDPSSLRSEGLTPERGREEIGKRRLPDDWKPNATSYELAEKLKRSAAWADEAGDEMREWSKSTDARKLDWDATHQVWMRRKAKDEARFPPRAPPGGSSRAERPKSNADIFTELAMEADERLRRKRDAQQGPFDPEIIPFGSRPGEQKPRHADAQGDERTRTAGGQLPFESDPRIRRSQGG